MPQMLLEPRQMHVETGLSYSRMADLTPRRGEALRQLPHLDALRNNASASCYLGAGAHNHLR